MLRNNNMQVIARMAGRSLRSHRQRSFTMILAVLLSSFMLFSVMTVGTTYFKMHRLENLRMNGGDFDAIMYGVTREQKKNCEENPDIRTFGVSAMSGYIEETEFDSTPNVSLRWADDIWWNEIMAPAREWVKGDYPKEVNEVMVTEYALEKCGFQGLGIGDEFSAVYGVRGEKQEMTFRICGIWDGYGDKSMFFVSEKFYQKTGYELSDVASGRICLKFEKKLITQKMQDAFIESMNLGKQQRVLFTMDSAFSVRILCGIAGLVLVTCLCAYLLIYNILYLSVAGNIRYYGLLQTIGMTGRQIRQLVRRQMLLIGGMGLSGGVLLGGGVSFLVVPSVVKALGVHLGKGGEITVAFHPGILALTVLITAVTVCVAGRKPAKMAEACSPVEALGYRPAASAPSSPRLRFLTGWSTRVRKKSKRCNRSVYAENLESGTHTNTCSSQAESNVVRQVSPTGRIRRMAMEQITKDKKKSGIVMLSLAAAMSVFLCMATLLASQAAREYNSIYRDFDMVIKNDTLQKENKEERVQIFGGEVMEKLNEIDGIEEINPLIYTEITVPWEPAFADQWMREFYDMWMNIPYEDDIEEYKEFPENFGSSIVGISKADFEALNEMLEQPADEEDFLSGKTCLLYRNGLDLENGEVKGKNITCTEYGDQENARTFEIAGLVDDNTYTALLGYPPTIIVSRQAVESFADEPVIFKMGVRYKEEKSRQSIRERILQTVNGYQPSKEYKETESAVLGVMEGCPYSRDYSYESRMKTMEEVKRAQGNMMEIGIGVVFILALIGVMNYINTFLGNIQNRRAEIAMLESIGMTGRQVKRMLLTEGLMYAAGAWAVTAVCGTAVTYLIYQSMNYMGAGFMIPVLPVAGMMILSGVICVSVPAAAYQKIEKEGIVEYIVMPY